jgi:hypothetical protein
MKKILFLLVIGGALFTASCTKRYDTVVPNQSITYTVKTTDWSVTADGRSDSVSLSANQIGNYLTKNGAVLVYFSFFEGVYEQIPEVYNNVSYSYYNNAGNLVLYSQDAVGSTPYLPTQDISVKLVLIPSN